MYDWGRTLILVGVIASELPEVMHLAHRVIVMHRGHQVAHFRRGEASAEDIVAAASGLRQVKDEKDETVAAAQATPDKLTQEHAV